MKPPEILGMLEEAAGTRMYENKKETALKTLEKKQVKVDEIDKVSVASHNIRCVRTWGKKPILLFTSLNIDCDC